MRLAAGTLIGPYKILALIGAGGMGEVYRARDSRLNRDVALKLLPAAFAHDPDRLARLKREAQILASLRHQNIAAIYGFEESSEAQALILELVDGPTLADRIAEGPIPLDEGLPIARQIAEALEAAHEQGIIHRDLKPANIKLRPGGEVTVLDFGLAKLASRHPGDTEGQGPDPTNAPTLSLAATHAGLVMGTPAYMAPEQARGHPVDKRADIWSFGCVLFEMLTGRRAFQGDDPSDTLATVLKGEPEWTIWPAGVPASISALVRRCLAKDPKHRIADATTALFVFNDLAPTRPEVASATHDPPKRFALSIAAGLVIASVAMLAAGAAVWFWRAPRDEEVYRSTIQATLTSDPNVGTALSLSPDGRQLAYIGLDANGGRLVYIRPLAELTARPLPGTERAQTLFWSPDSRFLAFVADNKLQTIDTRGNAAATVLAQESRTAAPGSWSTQNVILYTPTAGSPLFRISSTGGGTPSPVTTLDTEAGEVTHAFPFFLPDGRHFVYLAQAGGGVPNGVYIGSLDSKERTRLFDGGSNVQYARGALLFMRGSTLMAQPFDPRSPALTGESIPVADRVQVNEGTDFLRTGAFTVSDAGTLVYRADASEGSSLVWFDRAGRESGRLGDRAKYLDVVLSPDGSRAAVSIRDPGAATRDVWLYDVERGLRTRFTFDPEDDLDPRWSPDGSRVVFASRRKGHLDLYVKSASGVDNEQPLLVDNLDKYPQSWSPDGRFLLYVALGATTGQDLWVLPLEGDDRTPRPFLNTQYSEGTGVFSPDGQWIAYRSDETTRSEIYIAPFAGPGSKMQVSTTGGSAARWPRGSRELYYVGPGNMLMEAPVFADGRRVEIGPVKRLFPVRPVTPRYFFDVSPDGRRLLVNAADEATVSAPLTLVVGWPALLTQ